LIATAAVTATAATAATTIVDSSIKE